ncbi:dipeptidase [Sphingomonas aerolata]|uniref:dipeptidase n=1 Tax=Sphingomonas aerolata TaxID=185951 RepID=UPI002FDF59A0
MLSKTPVIDGHNDLAWEIRDVHGAKVESLDLAADTRPLQTDIPRLRKGRVGAQFWSVWVPADTTGPRAVEMTLEQIDIVHRFVAANPAALERATSAADIRRIEKAGRIASLIGVEGGHQIDGRLSVLRQYRALGVGYMTLTHGKSLNWADSSTDAPRANGLTDFGRAVVADMNRIGMIVDVSHVSDATMRAVLAAARAPVMASHSSARALTDAPRDIPDDLLAAIGANGGIVMVNFYPAFVSTAWRPGMPTGPPSPRLQACPRTSMARVRLRRSSPGTGTIPNRVSPPRPLRIMSSISRGWLAGIMSASAAIMTASTAPGRRG